MNRNTLFRAYIIYVASELTLASFGRDRKCHASKRPGDVIYVGTLLSSPERGDANKWL